MAELITVMAAKADDRAVLWEPNPDHPGGEAFIAGDGRAVTVALTPRVQEKLTAGTLIRVQVAPPSGGEPPPPVDAPPFDGYDALSADKVVERLAGMTDDEKTTVRTYEAAHKNRKTVLEALA